MALSASLCVLVSLYGEAKALLHPTADKKHKRTAEESEEEADDGNQWFALRRKRDPRG